MKTPNPQWIIGRTIVAYDNGTRADNPRSHGGASHDPTITLDNGARLCFIAEELESGDGYGICPLYVPPRRDGEN